MVILENILHYQEHWTYWDILKNTWLFLLLAFRHAGACLTLLYNIDEENLRGMNERMKERKNGTRSGFLILDRFQRKDLI